MMYYKEIDNIKIRYDDINNKYKITLYNKYNKIHYIIEINKQHNVIYNLINKNQEYNGLDRINKEYNNIIIEYIMKNKWWDNYEFLHNLIKE